MEDGAGLGIIAAILKVLICLSTLGSAGIGIAAATRVIEPESVRPWLVRALVLAFLALFAVVARLGLGTLQLGDMSLMSMVWDMQRWSIISVALGCVAFLVATVAPMKFFNIFLAFGSLSLAASFGATGHTHALENPSFWPYVVTGHVLIASFWLVAPAILWPSRNLGDAALASRVKRFGDIAIFIVPVLFIGGGILAYRLGGGIEGLIASAYGNALALKLGAALLILTLGAVNKTKVARAFDVDAVIARRWLRTTLSLDAVLFAIALIAIASATTLFGPMS